jgi:DNA-binding transcriptional LysR family regulator
VELRHLRYFAAVAETRHFGQAAERLHMAQPPLSQAIRQLEAELGAELLTRTTRRVDLTRAGEAFYADTLRVLQSVDDSVRRVRRIAEGRVGVLRIAFTGTASYRHLPAIARIVKRELPGVALEISSDMLTPEQEKALLEGRIDVGVLRPPVRHGSVRCRTVAVEPLVLVVPGDSPLADLPDLTVGDLRGEDFVLYDAPGSVVNDAVVRTCMAAGFAPHRAHEAAGTGVLLALVAAGLGVGLVPESVTSVAPEGVVFRSLPDAESVQLALAWRADDDSPLLETLLTTLEEQGVFSLPTGRSLPGVATATEDLP